MHNPILFISRAHPAHQDELTSVNYPDYVAQKYEALLLRYSARVDPEQFHDYHDESVRRAQQKINIINLIHCRYYGTCMSARNNNQS